LSFGAKFKSLKSGYTIAAFFRTKQIVNLDKNTGLQSLITGMTPQQAVAHSLRLAG
jgi:hypothetical protein